MCVLECAACKAGPNSEHNGGHSQDEERAVNCHLWSAAQPQPGSVWEKGKVEGSRKWA